MAFSLFQPSLNLTMGHSSYPAPIAPDTFYCNYWYAEPDPPDPADCQVALDLLPSGTDDEPFSYHFSNDDPNRLPLNVSHGNCQIQFHTSGESAEEKDPIIINPKEIRDMAGWVLDKCVLKEELGGFVTKDLANAVDWLLDPKSDFAEPMPASTTFFSLHICNFEVGDETWNPGDWDPAVGAQIGSCIDDAVEGAPEGSELKYELEHRYRVLEDAIDHMERDSDQRNPRDWWTPPRHQKLALNSSVLTLSNASSLKRLPSRTDGRARLTET